MNFRRGTPGDIAELMAIELDAAQAYRSLTDHAFAAHLPVRDREEHDLVLREGASFVAEDGDRPVGFLTCLPLDGHAHILELAVRLAMQGIGVGSKLLEVFERWAIASGFPRATLVTYRDVPWNAPFYARRDCATFTPENDRRDLLSLIEDEKKSGGWGAPRVAMYKTLRSPFGANGPERPCDL